jgi:hypothetical protein
LFLGLPSFLAALGCAIEDPYPEEALPPARSAPLSVRDVIDFLREGFAEEAISARIRTDGLDLRPTDAEIQELRCIGAGEPFIARLVATTVRYPFGDPRASGEVRPQLSPFYLKP